MHKHIFSHKEFLKLLLGSIVLVVVATGYKFLINKDYDFVVEAVCDPSVQTCFNRDCSEGDCPPNELEDYRQFIISASDFSKCSDNSCLEECLSKAISCEEIMCDEGAGDICTN